MFKVVEWKTDGLLTCKYDGGGNFIGESTFLNCKIGEHVLVKDQDNIEQNGIYKIVRLKPFRIRSAIDLTKLSDFEVRVTDGSVWKMYKNGGVARITFEEITKPIIEINEEVMLECKITENTSNVLFESFKDKTKRPNNMECYNLLKKIENLESIINELREELTNSKKEIEAFNVIFDLLSVRMSQLESSMTTLRLHN